MGRFTHAHFAGGGRERKVSSRLGQDHQGVWQLRYRVHRTRDEKDCFRHRAYIHLNRVRHGHVELPEDRPYPSFHKHGIQMTMPGASRDLRAFGETVTPEANHASHIGPDPAESGVWRAGTRLEPRTFVSG